MFAQTFRIGPTSRNQFATGFPSPLFAPTFPRKTPRSMPVQEGAPLVHQPAVPHPAPPQQARFEIGDHDFLLDGAPHRILAGALHYFRIHPDQWADRIHKARLMGLNTIETYVAWNSRYTSNVAPTVTLDAPVTAAPGEAVDLTASWPACGEGPCEGAETYVVYDTDTRTLTTRREAVSVAWFATGGTFSLARNGRSGDDDAPTATNTWTAPEAGTAHLWVVARDERGGVGFSGVEIAIGE